MYLFLDTETSKITSPSRKDMRLVQIGAALDDGPYQSYVIDHRDAFNPHYLERWQAWARDFDGTVVGHNLPFDVGVLADHGVTFPKARYYDTFLALKCWNENEPTYSLKAFLTYLGYPPYWLDFKEAMGDDAGGAEHFPLSKLVEYNGYDVRGTRDLFRWVRDKVPCPAILDLENACVPLVTAMQEHGLMPDETKCRQLIAAMKLEAERVQAEMSAEFGPINLNSPGQLADLLYDRLKLPPHPDRKFARSTADEVLKTWEHPVVARIKAHRRALKLVKTYLIPWIEQRDRFGVFRGDFTMHGAESARMTCKGGLQTMPKRTKPSFRQVFIPQFGNFVSLDLSQIEFRIVADLAGETALIEAIGQGYDVHTAAAKAMFGKTDDVYRQQAKTCNFAILYGIGIPALAAQLNISVDKAGRLVAKFRRTFPRISAWVESVHSDVVAGKTIYSPFGRRRNLFTVPRSVGQLRGLQREAVNFIPQSTGHDILSHVWTQLDAELRGLGGWAYANEVHDELLLDVADEALDRVQAVCKNVLSDVNRTIGERFGYSFKVPIEGDVKSGTSWE